eukprot:TRINITY_DN794_c1_g1_i1.p1 TRINITY_DN794_c1_g1~~TRINITY_DN794_c1_g1_i1.p1  ORF type:complete len:135 (+),score=27.24 TRINITY_DN794_c1_g1_i1:61-465(+)
MTKLTVKPHVKRVEVVEEVSDGTDSDDTVSCPSSEHLHAEGLGVQDLREKISRELIEEELKKVEHTMAPLPGKGKGGSKPLSHAKKASKSKETWKKNRTKGTSSLLNMICGAPNTADPSTAFVAFGEPSLASLG